MKTEKNKSIWGYHAVAIFLVIVGYIVSGFTAATNTNITGINEITLAVKELWWVGLALLIELIAIANKE